MAKCSSAEYDCACAGPEASRPMTISKSRSVKSRPALFPAEFDIKFYCQDPLHLAKFFASSNFMH